MKLVCLRLWLTSIYGWYLIFRDGQPIGCISPKFFEDLKRFLSSDSTEKRSDFSKIISLQDYQNGVELIEVDPSKSSILDNKVC